MASFEHLDTLQFLRGFGGNQIGCAFFFPVGVKTDGQMVYLNKSAKVNTRLSRLVSLPGNI